MSYLLSSTSAASIRSKNGFEALRDGDPFLQVAELQIDAGLPPIDGLNSALSARERCTLFDTLVASQHAAFVTLNGDAYAANELLIECVLPQNEMSIANT